MMPPSGSQSNPVITPELQASMNDRSQGGVPPATLNQTAANAPPQAPPMPPNPGPAMQPTPSAEQPTSEAQIIIKAMAQRLKDISKVEQQGGRQDLQAMPLGF